MIRRPETRYARAHDGAYLAYQVVGAGEVDVIFHPGAVTHLEMIWDFPTITRFIQRLASMARVITFDARGVGASDPIPIDRPYGLDDVVSDVLAIVDASGATNPAFMAETFSGPAFLRIAAQYPERVRALVLSGTYARFLRAPDYPIGLPPERLDDALQRLEETWGTGASAALFMPSLAASSAQRAEWARYERGCVSPGRVTRFARTWWTVDARADAALITVPTLVVHSVDDPIVPIEHARYLAEHIPDARFVERHGDRHATADNVEDVIAICGEFLLGHSAVSVPGALTTVAFVDIADSTGRASRVGDRRWRDLLDDFRQTVRAELVVFDGREVNTRGDDFLLEFGAPRSAVACVLAIRERAEVLGLDVRAGVHVGEVEQLGDDLAGLAVHIGARIAELARAGDILVSQTVRDVVIGSGLELADRGTHELKGVPGEWSLFAVGS